MVNSANTNANKVPQVDIQLKFGKDNDINFISCPGSVIGTVHEIKPGLITRLKSQSDNGPSTNSLQKTKRSW